MNPISEEMFQLQGLPQHSHSARGKGSLLRFPNSGIFQGILQMYHQQVDQTALTALILINQEGFRFRFRFTLF